MQLFALAAVTLPRAARLGIGARLPGLARRTHELPELCIGASLLAGGMFGHPLTVAASLLEASRPGARAGGPCSSARPAWRPPPVCGR